MAQKILITNFTYDFSRQEYEKITHQLAQDFAHVPGCHWKIWLLDERNKQAGAVYLFKDQQSLDDFKASPLVASVLAHPALSAFELRERDILKEVSNITHAPLMEDVLYED